MTDHTIVADQADVEIEIYDDYFGFGETKRHYLPDGRQYIEFQVMNEGQRREFQKLTNRDITVNRVSNDAKIKADPAEERLALLMTSVVGWNLKRRVGEGRYEDVTFSKRGPASRGPGTFEDWLEKANPKIVDDLEFTIRKANPWMQAEMTVEQIDEELNRLTELRKQVEEREKGEGSSSSK